MNRLVIITENYPYGKGEEFFETEIEYLHKHFDHVDILSMSEDVQLTREVPANTTVTRLSIESGMVGIFHLLGVIIKMEFWEELGYIIRNNHGKRKLPMVKFLAWSMVRGDRIARAIDSIIQPLELDHPVFLYSYWMHYGAYAIARIRKHSRVDKAFCRVHGFDLYFDRNEMNYIPLRSYISEGVDAIYPISLHGLEYLKEKIPNQQHKLSVSRLGIRGTNYSYNPVEDDGTLHIMSLSGFTEVKRVHLIVESLALLDTINVIWTHIGTGPLESEVMHLAKKCLDGKENIQYDFLGYLANSYVMQYYRTTTVDLFINVSESEGIPVSMMEAQSFSIPIVATAVGGVPEIVNEKNGILLPPNPKCEEVADAVRKFAGLSKLKKNEMRKNAFNHWKEFFNAEINYEGFIESIKNL